MRKVQVYVDTSVFGGVYDDEFAEASKRFFSRVRDGEYLVLVSQITLDELLEAPEKVREVLSSLPEGSVRELPVDDETKNLARAYVDAGALDEAFSEDASHVAVASVAGANLILSWNFRHIVNYTRIQKFNAVNLLNGYKTMDVRSPLEVEYGNESQDI